MTTDRTHAARPAAPLDRRPAAQSERGDGSAFAALLDAHASPRADRERPAAATDRATRDRDAAGTDRAARDRTSGDSTAPERAAGDAAGTERAAQDGTSGDTTATDRAAQDRAAGDGAASDGGAHDGAAAKGAAPGAALDASTSAEAPAVTGAPARAGAAAPPSELSPPTKPIAAAPVPAADASPVPQPATPGAVVARDAVITRVPVAAPDTGTAPAVPAQADGEPQQTQVSRPSTPVAAIAGDDAAPPVAAPGAPARPPLTPAAAELLLRGAVVPGASAPPKPATAPEQAVPASPAAPVAAEAAPSSPPLAGHIAPHRAAPLHRAPAAVATLLQVASDRGITHAKLALRPAELGGIEIRLQSTAAGVTAQVVADSPEAARLLAQAGDDLRRALEARDVTLVSLDVSTSSEQQRRESARGELDDAAGGPRGDAPAGRPESEADAPTSPTTVIELPGGLLVDVLA